MIEAVTRKDPAVGAMFWIALGVLVAAAFIGMCVFGTLAIVNHALKARQ
jgi:hypothetical protein